MYRSKLINSLALAAMMILSIVTPAGASVVIDRVVAVVNNEAITWSDLYGAMREEIQRRYGDVSPENEKQFFKQSEYRFLEEMIDARLQEQEARNMGIDIAEADVTEAIENIRSKYGLDKETFAKQLAEQGMTMQSYRDSIGKQMRTRRLVDRAVRSKVDVTEQDVKSWLSSRGLTDGTRYALKQIFFSQNKPGGLQGAQARADAAYERLSRGEDFATVMRAVSEDPSAAKTGGDLGYIERERMQAEFAAAVEGVMPGSISRPFVSAQGVHILLVEDVMSARETLKDERFKKALRSWVRGLRDKAFIEIRL